MFIHETKTPKGYADDYFKKIAGEPDHKLYLSMDEILYNDGYFLVDSLYPVHNSTTRFSPPLINKIQFEMPPFPPFFNWERLPKVLNTIQLFLLFQFRND